MLVLHTAQLAVGDPVERLRLDQHWSIIARLWKLHLLAGDRLEACRVGILVDLAPVRQNLRVNTLRKRTAFGNQPLTRGVQLIMGEIGNSARALELQNETR